MVRWLGRSLLIPTHKLSTATDVFGDTAQPRRFTANVVSALGSAGLAIPMLPIETRPETLCRYAGRTCGACCWGNDVSRQQLERQVSMNTCVARMLARLPAADAIRGVLQEVIARRGHDLFLAPLLWIPFLAGFLRARFSRSVVCAFLAFEDSSQSRLGCLLHPSRCGGAADRRTMAFRLLRAVACGAGDYFCAEARRFSASGIGGDDARSMSQWHQELPTDWYEYSMSIRQRSAQYSRDERSPLCRSLSTRP